MGVTDGGLNYRLVYRLGLAFWNTFQIDRGLTELVAGANASSPGRALDLGCGSGRNAVYLARNGWDVTGVDFTPQAIAQARSLAAAEGVSVRLVRGDVTRLGELGIGDGYTLLIDFGCFHGVPTSRRDAYAEAVTAVAAPGATLWMWGLGRCPQPGLGVTAEELTSRFSGWRLDVADAVSRSELRAITSHLPVALKPLRVVMGMSWFPEVCRFRLTRRVSSLDAISQS